MMTEQTSCVWYTGISINNFISLSLTRTQTIVFFSPSCTLQQGDPNSANAQKKAAKKAEKAAKKAAMKATTGGGTNPPPAKPVPVAKPAPVAAAAPSKPAAATTKKSSKPAMPGNATTQAFYQRIPAHALVWNPNADAKPVVSMTMAILAGTVLDYTLVPDYKAPGIALGLPKAVVNDNSTENNGGVVQGDLAIARYMARQAASGVHHFRDGRVLSFDFLPSSQTALSAYPSNQLAVLATIDMWLDYAQSLQRLNDATQQFQAVVLTLEKALAAGRTYCTGHVLTLADVAMFALLGFPTTQSAWAALQAKLPSTASHTLRWLHMMAVHPALQEATQLCAGEKTEVTDFVGRTVTLDPLETGMNALEGALPGQVVTRFPPEPSGYLHIGHAKAVLLNDYYARRYKGRLLLRFDDTNPSKEKDEFQASFPVDLAKLGVKPDVVSYASDYFHVCKSYAVKMMQAGLAYMDDTPQEIMKEEREKKQNSKHRDVQTPAEALEKFELMCSGDPEGSAWCLRAKIDMQSDNGTLRDPVLYRQNLTPHHRTGTTFKAYPTYDFSWYVCIELGAAFCCLNSFAKCLN